MEDAGLAQKALEAYEGILAEVRSTGGGQLLAEVLLESSQAAIAAGNYPLAIQRASESAAIADRSLDFRALCTSEEVTSGASTVAS